jgi:DNA adenine methylase
MGLDSLELALERLKNVYIYNMDFERLVANWDRPDTLFYCDPPYWMMPEKGRRPYYQCGFEEEEDHVRLRDTPPPGAADSKLVRKHVAF